MKGLYDLCRWHDDLNYSNFPISCRNPYHFMSFATFFQNCLIKDKWAHYLSLSFIYSVHSWWETSKQALIPLEMHTEGATLLTVPVPLRALIWYTASARGTKWEMMYNYLSGEVLNDVSNCLSTRRTWPSILSLVSAR